MAVQKPYFIYPLFILTLLLCSTDAVTRVYYVGIDRVRWDYYPIHSTNRSLNAGPIGDQCTAAPFAEDQLLFVGDGSAAETFTPTSVYDKILFREYSNLSFSTPIRRAPQDKHLGLLGPILRVASGDRLVVYVRGVVNGDDVFSFDVNGLQRMNKTVHPGQIVKYEYDIDWRMTGGGSISSRMLLYQGIQGEGVDVDGGAGIYRGLLGAVIVYRAAALTADGFPVGVERELVTILWVGNENQGDEEGDEEESNLMHGINGRVYCSLEGLDMKFGEPTRWYFGAVGNEVDVHTAHMHGIVGVDAGGAHTDSVRLLPGATSVVEFEPDNVGTWLFHCHVNDHLHAGMQALFTVYPPDEQIDHFQSFQDARERVYYVQAEDEIWDYAPRGQNICDDTVFGDDESIFVDPEFSIELEDGSTGFGIGSKYTKSRYIEYTDATFTKRVERDEKMAHLGLMGPVLRARVGEVIVVHFRNNASEFVSMHPHGVLYTKANEGSPYNDGTSSAEKLDDRIAPGDSYVYRWPAPERAGPGPGERPDAKLWMYHSHRNEIADTYAGLFGPIVVIGKDAPYDSENLIPRDGEREVFLHMSVMNEGGSFHLKDNVRRTEGNQDLTEEQLEMLLGNEEFEESNLMHSINGYLYCNGPLVTLRKGQRTRFYFYALGTEVDIHTPMISSEVLNLDVHSSRGSAALLAGSFSSALVRPRHVGLQELRCNVNDHVVAGMRALYFVEGDGPDGRASNIDVTHYISADEVEWDYTPLHRDGCTGASFGDDEEVFTRPGPFTPGSRYVKAAYREYTDESFSIVKERNDTEYAGIVGPLLHFAVNETVRIVFQNRLEFACNLNIVGLEQISSTLAAEEVPKGARTTYLFRVRPEAGPTKEDLNSVPYVYYSSVDPISHTAAGLTGVIAVSREGKLDSNRLPVNTTRAVPLLFNIFRENESPLLQRSLERFTLNRVIGPTRLASLMEDEDWLESNAMHSVNGYLYGNGPRLEGKIGERVRFYVFGFGSEASMHSPIWAGQVALRRVTRGSTANGVQILPFNAEGVDVELVSNGLWAISCAVADHVLGGMKVCLNVGEMPTEMQ